MQKLQEPYPDYTYITPKFYAKQIEKANKLSSIRNQLKELDTALNLPQYDSKGVP